MTKDEATWRCTHGWLRGEQCEICQAQPAQGVLMKEALKLALEALEDYQEHIHRKKTQDAITAIKEALAQPVQGQPLTDEKLIEMFGNGPNGKVFQQVARLIEAAHNIGAKP